MSLADDLNWRPATELARLIRSKAISPVELLQAHLATIEQLNPKINAICTLAAESAMAAAQRAEQTVMAGDEIGSLHGVPIGIKDLTPTAGIRTTFGSPLYADHVPSEDAAVVKRIKQAGAIVVAKTNTPEFGAGANTVNRLFGATRNPWDLALTVGGSSGGGAAALAGHATARRGHRFRRLVARSCGVLWRRRLASHGRTGSSPSHTAAMGCRNRARTDGSQCRGYGSAARSDDRRRSQPDAYFDRRTMEELSSGGGANP
jgi:amidase